MIFSKYFRRLFNKIFILSLYILIFKRPLKCFDSCLFFSNSVSLRMLLDARILSWKPGWRCVVNPKLFWTKQIFIFLRKSYTYQFSNVSIVKAKCLTQCIDVPNIDAVPLAISAQVTTVFSLVSPSWMGHLIGISR